MPRDRKQIEEIAMKRGSANSRFERDLNPEYPKWAATCPCGFSVSTFKESERRLIRRVGGEHAGNCESSGPTELLKFDSDEDEPQVLDTLSGGEMR